MGELYQDSSSSLPRLKLVFIARASDSVRTSTSISIFCSRLHGVPADDNVDIPRRRTSGARFMWFECSRPFKDTRSQVRIFFVESSRGVQKDIM